MSGSFSPPAVATGGSGGNPPIALAYTTPGTFTYTIPEGRAWIRILAISGGAGGGSGRRGANGTARFGGGGGGGGFVTDVIYQIATLQSRILTIVVPSGGLGGAAVTANDTNGNNGTVGAGVLVSIPERNLAFTISNNAGLGGSAANGNGGATFAFALNNFMNIAGGNSSITATGSVGLSGVTHPAGGSGGGGIDAADVSRAGGGGSAAGRGFQAQFGSVANAGNGGAVGANGTDAVANTGSGGGGGGASTTTNAGNGGNGSSPGGGGGGGGASLNGFNSGAGGNGGNGAVYLYIT